MRSTQVVFLLGLSGCLQAPTDPGTPAPVDETQRAAGPTSLAAVAAAGRIELTWSAVAGATRYLVHWRTNAGVGRDNAATFGSSQSPALHVGLQSDTTYYYAVGALLNGVETRLSNEASAKTPADAAAPPATPTNLQATPGDRRVDLSWSPSAGATTYVVRESFSFTMDPVADSVTVSSTTAAFGSLFNGGSYYFSVAGKNTAGESAPTGAVEATPMAASTCTGLAAPTGVTITPRDRAVVVDWSLVGGATSYRAFVGGFTPVFTDNDIFSRVADAPPVTFGGLANDLPTYVVVYAQDIGGRGCASLEVNTTPTSAAPLLATSFDGETFTTLTNAGWAFTDLSGGAATNNFDVTSDSTFSFYCTTDCLHAFTDVAIDRRAETPDIVAGSSAPIVFFTYYGPIGLIADVLISSNPGVWTSLAAIDSSCILAFDSNSMPYGCVLQGYENTTFKLGFFVQAAASSQQTFIIDDLEVQ